MEDEHSNTLRILIATDCHLGYMEKDEIRRNDSFYAFDEICSIAEEQQVDFLLLGGDLFHENKPSRTALVRVLEILRRYCLNDQPVRFQVVSDQAVNFPNRFGRVNYEDPHFNVGLPVFTIHGNHDDPAGVDNLSALDILSACNLVNYFGKMVLEGSGVGQITLHPILIQKGFTKVALYGLGNIRDERLNRMFQTAHAVRWIRPENRDDCSVSEWFNILVLHQNRVKMNPKNAINEQFLPRYLDFVIWGHEHECLIDPEEVSGMGFHITQPGSSIATSLIEGEAKPKHVLLLEVKGNQYRPTKIPLKSVRPFEFADVSLKDIPDLNSNDPDSVIDHLSKLVHELIARANIAAVSRPELKLPLIRVRVDYTGFTTINPQRFGQKFVGKVANPHDILTFTKAARKRQSTNVKEENELLRPEELNQQNIEALVAESNLKMEILPVNDLDLALHEFVNKDDRQAFYNCVQNNLEETRTKLIQEADALTIAEEKDLIEKVSQCMQEREKNGGSRVLARPSSVAAEASQDLPIHNLNRASKLAFSDDDDDLLGSMGTSKENSKGKLASGSSSKGAAGRGRGRSSRGGMKQTTLDMSLGARRSKREASRVSTSAVRSEIEDENNSLSSSDKAVEEEDLDEAESEPEPLPTPRGRGRKRQSSAGQGRGRGLQEPAGKRGRKSALPASTMRTTFSDANHDDDDNDEDDDSGKRGASSGLRSQAPRSWGSLRR